ncbi:RNA-directed DNA polymerase, eukaryota [Tanacetum coccineum]
MRVKISKHFVPCSLVIGKQPQVKSSLLDKLNDFVKIGQAMGFPMEGCLNNIEELKTKMEWVGEGVVRSLWGNLFDYAFSPAVGNSGGVLCVWDVSVFVNVESFSPSRIIITMIDNTQRNNKEYNQSYHKEISKKRLLWDYLHGVLDRWKGEVILMGDFNEVHMPFKRRGSVFNKQGAALFNSFILSSGLIEVSLGRYTFTWAQKDAAKMSQSCYGSWLWTSLWGDLLFNYAFSLAVRNSGIWKFMGDRMLMIGVYAPQEISEKWLLWDYSGVFVRWKGEVILMGDFNEEWFNASRSESNDRKLKIQMKIQNIDKHIDIGECGEDLLSTRRLLCKELLDIDNVEVKELAQKEKVKWAIEDDENSKFFHASGLRINLHKCSIIGVGGVKTEEVLRKATLIGCDIGKTPFKYLRVMVGTSMSKIKAWDMIVDRITTRLSK